MARQGELYSYSDDYVYLVKFHAPGYELTIALRDNPSISSIYKGLSLCFGSEIVTKFMRSIGMIATAIAHVPILSEKVEETRTFYAADDVTVKVTRYILL